MPRRVKGDDLAPRARRGRAIRVPPDHIGKEAREKLRGGNIATLEVSVPKEELRPETVRIRGKSGRRQNLFVCTVTGLGAGSHNGGLFIYAEDSTGGIHCVPVSAGRTFRSRRDGSVEEDYEISDIQYDVDPEDKILVRPGDSRYYMMDEHSAAQKGGWSS